MDDLDSLLEGLSAKSPKRREQSFEAVRKLIRQGEDEPALARAIPVLARQVARGDLGTDALYWLQEAARTVAISAVIPTLEELVPVLARLAAQPEPDYNVFRLLVLAARGGVDISTAIPPLAHVGRVRGQTALRGAVNEILRAYYEESGRPRPLVPRQGLALPQDWSLEEVNPSSVCVGQNLDAQSRVKSKLPCGVCGSQQTVTTYELNDSAVCEISGMVEIWNEIECLECKNYSVYQYFDQWFPGD